ncbi:MAG: hypothetical protein ACXWUD_04360, partial [Methylosarcina sp.]
MNDLLYRSIGFLIEANFYISVISLITAGVMAISGGPSFFEFNEDLYGPLANNLRIMLIYLTIAEVILCSYCFLIKQFKIFIIAGFFLILTSGSLKFYSVINDIAVDENFFVFFLYLGLSHILFGIIKSK